MATRPEKGYATEIQTIGKTRLYLNAVSRIHRRRKLSNMGGGGEGGASEGTFNTLGRGGGGRGRRYCKLWGLYRGSMDTGYLPFYFPEYTSTMFDFRDTAIFPPKYRNTD